MAPLWIHQQSIPLDRGEDYLKTLGRRLNPVDDMQTESPMHSVLIKEKKRMFLVDKIGNQPQKSMFNIGDYRHNKHMGIESNNKVPVVNSPERFLQWQERKDSTSPSRDTTFTRFVR